MNKTDEEQVQADVGKKRRLQFILVLLVAGIGLGWLVYQRSTHVYTDAPRLSGRPVRPARRPSRRPQRCSRRRPNPRC